MFRIKVVMRKKTYASKDLSVKGLMSENASKAPIGNCCCSLGFSSFLPLSR